MLSEKVEDLGGVVDGRFKGGEVDGSPVLFEPAERGAQHARNAQQRLLERGRGQVAACEQIVHVTVQ